MRAVAVFLLCCGPLVAHAQSQSSITLTLQDAILRARQQGPAAQAARSTRDAARWRDEAFKARLLPQLVLSGDAANLDRGINPVDQSDGSTQFLSQARNTTRLGLGFNQEIPLTGGRLSVGTQISRHDEFGTRSSRLYQTSPILVQLEQQLFRPRQIVWDKRMQHLDARVAEQAYLEAREDVAQATADAFFNLYAQEVALRNASNNVAVNDTLYTLNKGRFEVGKIGENDLLKSELALLRARAAVEDARVARARAEAALRRQIALPRDGELTIVTPDSIPIVDADPELAEKEALRNSSVIQQNELDDVQSRYGVSVAKSNSRFNATVAATAGFNQTASAFGESYQNPLGRQQLSVGINLPMAQWGAGRAGVEAAKATSQRVTTTNRIRRDALAEDARFSALQLQQAQRTVVLAAKADTVAGKQFEVAHNRYIIGKIANDALYLAQGEKDAAVLAYVQALRTYWMSYYHLRRVTLYDFAEKRELVDDR
jgi:outer membrane protein TolC